MPIQALLGSFIVQGVYATVISDSLLSNLQSGTKSLEKI